MLSKIASIPQLNLEEFKIKFWQLKEKADHLLLTKRGRRVRLALAGSVIVVYPTIYLLVTGPLIKFTFKYWYRTNSELPEHLNTLVNEQTLVWMNKEGRVENDTFVKFSCQRSSSRSLDSISAGSLSAGTGAQIALPFYAQFESEEEARQYAKRHLEPLNVLGKKAHIDWDSDLGRRLLSTFVLSPNAIKFLIIRDLYRQQHSTVRTEEAYSWVGLSFVGMSLFYGLDLFHFKGNSLYWFMAFPVIFALTAFCAMSWHKFAAYFHEHHADIAAAKLSQIHTLGGKEYYTKYMARNRILRGVVKRGDKLFTEVGDQRKAIAQYVVRFNEVNVVHSENEELQPCIPGDDLPTQF